MSTTWAFLISVAEYDDQCYNLSYVHGDNECIKHGLINGLKIPPEQIVICGSNCYVKYADFQAMISSHDSMIADSDRVIIYFSGHGGRSPFSLKFSNMWVDFSKFCDEIDTLSAYAKIFILDCCFAGNAEIPENAITNHNPSYDLFNYTRSGYAIFASSNTGSFSSRHPKKDVSLYTCCISKAFQNTRIRNGKISLIDAAKFAALEVDYIAKEHRKSLQHPIFKCQIPGDVLFRVAEENPKKVNVYSSSCEDYDIYSTTISHSPIEMRYSISAIAKGVVDEEHIAQYTEQIVKEVIPLREFENQRQAIRFLNESVKVVFVYWGANKSDIIRGNWLYRSIWADPTSNRDNWYRLDKNSKIISDMWISIMPHYNMLEEFYRENMIGDTELIECVHETADSLLGAAGEVVRYFEEYESGEIPEGAFIQACTEPFKVIRHDYQKMSNLPISSDRLKEWTDEYICLAASIDDMQLIYTSEIFKNREESNRKYCMRGVVKRYREELQKLIRIEDHLKKCGVLA